MNFKKVLTGIFAAALIMTNSVYAVEPNDNTAGTQTTAPVQQSETTSSTTPTTTSIWTMPTTTTTYAEPDEPTSEPATVKLDVGKIKNGKFSVNLIVDSEAPVSSASVSVEFDKDLLELESTKQNAEAGGMAVENTFEGKYVFNYVNADGSDYNGSFVTLNFKILDEDMTSTVLYLTVTSLDNNKLRPIAFKTENGIVTYKTTEEVEAAAKAAAKTVKLQLSENAVTLESLGISDVKDCTVENGQLLIYEDKKLKTLGIGETMIEVVHSDDKKEYIKVIIEAPVTEAPANVNSSSAADTSAKTEKAGFSAKNIIIILIVIAGAAAIIVEYYVIMKPSDKKAAENSDDDDSDESFDESDNNSSDEDENECENEESDSEEDIDSDSDSDDAEN